MKRRSWSPTRRALLVLRAKSPDRQAQRPRARRSLPTTSIQAVAVVSALLLRLDLAVSAVPAAVPARSERHQRNGHEKTGDGGATDS
jgi:hypothetical protein